MVERLQVYIPKAAENLLRIVVDAKGDYVRVTDYAALERQLAEARAAHQKTSHKAVKRLRALWREKEAAEAERDRLAAELARLEGALERVEALAQKYEAIWGYDDDLRKGVGMQTVGQVTASEIRLALAGKE